ncbi:MAG: ribonuclease E/G [Deltaproteobacteria bacterium CG2_30_63_29]|nr:MAG: ribonuclease E/G [Deltaproteobacteria bacterium CG2_30_63_29]PIW02418.1 MAG: Rne/Rng family ribonuclease [Deltaproteobacteria bacterium CG17_big_fil_post_rev_8_21_14_2_50_63_7]PJB45289.1 MAG: Rne/Rng family ribonuclease [Deltaproteobacteria bacterium CG_4_9_14_3_um_filter_63_12]
MGSILVFNTTAQETRVALVEQGVITEFYVERSRDRSSVGNVYKGRVLRVLPGMQAAFVDIGLERAAFLYVADVYNQHEAYLFDGAPEGEDEIANIPQSRGRTRPTGPIEQRLIEGQEILVQVSKEPIGAKGARVTSHVTLPGRYLVHMPTFDHIGVSRRILEESERDRLKDVVAKHRQPGTGFIVRTASESIPEPQLERDLDYLSNLWREIIKGFDAQPAPALLYEDLDLALRAARDLFTNDVDKLVIDDETEFARVHSFVEKFMPSLVESVVLYQRPEPIFDAYGIEIEIARSLGRKVWLKSGGHIVIDTTEALTAVDINTGKFVGQHTLEDTIVQINLEAVKEIVYQLRLRNIGGLIIIDFIDMEKMSNREKVYAALEERLKTDKAKTNILEISEFGLVEMTRKRVRESLVQTLCEPCFYCEGRGYIKSRESVAYEILREIRRMLPRIEAGEIEVLAHPDVAHLLYDEERDSIEKFEQATAKRIEIKAHPSFHIEQFEVMPVEKIG